MKRAIVAALTILVFTGVLSLAFYAALAYIVSVTLKSVL